MRVLGSGSVVGRAADWAQGSLSLSAFDDGFVEAQSSDWFTRRRGGAEMFFGIRVH